MSRRPFTSQSVTAENVVVAKPATRRGVRVAYAIGKAEPIGPFPETFGTETVPADRVRVAVVDVLGLRPAAIIRDPDLLRPIRGRTAAYGRLGRARPGSARERTDRAAALRAAAGV